MADQINPNYQGMSLNTASSSTADAESETQKQLAEMRSGEHWSLTATERSYNAGGIQNGTMTQGSPQGQ